VKNTVMMGRKLAFLKFDQIISNNTPLLQSIICRIEGLAVSLCLARETMDIQAIVHCSFTSINLFKLHKTTGDKTKVGRFYSRINKRIQSIRK
jgi:hypothetical protein